MAKELYELTNKELLNLYNAQDTYDDATIAEIMDRTGMAEEYNAQVALFEQTGGDDGCWECVIDKAIEKLEAMTA